MFTNNMPRDSVIHELQSHSTTWSRQQLNEVEEELQDRLRKVSVLEDKEARQCLSVLRDPPRNPPLSGNERRKHLDTLRVYAEQLQPLSALAEEIRIYLAGVAVEDEARREERARSMPTVEHDLEVFRAEFSACPALEAGWLQSGYQKTDRYELEIGELLAGLCHLHRLTLAEQAANVFGFTSDERTYLKTWLDEQTAYGGDSDTLWATRLSLAESFFSEDAVHSTFKRINSAYANFCRMVDERDRERELEKVRREAGAAPATHLPPRGDTKTLLDAAVNKIRG